MVARRSPREIGLAVLASAAEPVRFTHLMYRANLNHRSLARHLDELARRGLVVREGPLWVVTWRGRELLRHARAVEEAWGRSEGDPAGPADPGAARSPDRATG